MIRELFADALNGFKLIFGFSVKNTEIKGARHTARRADFTHVTDEQVSETNNIINMTNVILSMSTHF